MRAVVEGERSHRWDFSQGPCHVRLVLRVSNRREVAASLCCETGTTLDLSISDADRTAFRPPSPDGKSRSKVWMVEVRTVSFHVYVSKS